MLIIYGYDFYPNTNNCDEYKKSGLSLYNTLQLYGLKDYGFSPIFIRSYYGDDEILSKNIIDGIEVFNMPVRFSQYFEPNSIFDPKLPLQFYSQDISLDNPIYFSLCKNLQKIIDSIDSKEEKEIYINTHNFTTTIVACLLKKHYNARNLKIYATIHDVDVKLVPFIIDHQKLIQNFIAISNTNQEILRNIGIDTSKILLIHNGIDVENLYKNLWHCRSNNLWNQICERNSIDQSYSIITLPGRRVQQKGHSVAFEAIKYLLENTSVKVLLLVTGFGMGPNWYLEKLKNLVIEMNIKKNVVFLGKIINLEEMLALYDNSDLIVTPSIEKEGFCYANIECMLVAKAPIITSNFGGVLDYIEHLKTGYLFPPNDHIELANAIHLLLKDKNLKNSIVNNAKKIAIEFDVKDMMRKYIELFRIKGA